MYGHGGLAHVYARKAHTPRPCESCSGSGYMETETITMPCQDCNGTGQAADPKVSVWTIAGALVFLLLCYGGFALWMIYK